MNYFRRFIRIRDTFSRTPLILPADNDESQTLRREGKCPDAEWELGMRSPRWFAIPLNSVSCWVLLSIAPVAFELSSAAEARVLFNRDIRPILSDYCFACHGPDDSSRKGDLRLDTKDGLYEETDKHEPAVIPGDLQKSELWYRITTTDEDDIMPPTKSEKTLQPEQKDMIRQWILDGAPWEGHWSFVKPQRPAVPDVLREGFEIRNPIDAFVLSVLESKQIAPAKEADRRTLARRLSLDLTGLPPRTEDVEAFVSEEAPNAYERYVNHLMNSPHWGEHRGRYWLDAARYADTHGLHFDNYREIWPYRDWVIRAFSNNMPFDQFTVEQIAGDLLENPTQDQIVATGFQRCNMTTNEGGTIEAENLVNYANDRVTTTGWVWLGLTVNCAACHDHKFDPVTTRDFYSLASYYRNTKQSGFDRNRRESDLYVVVPQTQKDRDRWDVLPSEIEVARRVFEERESEVDVSFTNWLATAEAQDLGNEVVLSDEHLRLTFVDDSPTRVPGRIAEKDRAFAFSGKLGWRGDGPYGAAPILSREHTLTIPNAGDFDASEPFSGGAWVFLPDEFKGEGSLMSRMEGLKGSEVGWDLFVRDRDFGVNLIHRRRSNAMKVRAREKTMNPGKWQHLFFTYGGTRHASDVKLYVDGIEVAANRDSDRLEHSIRANAPLRIGRREDGHELNGVSVQDVRIYRRQLDAWEVRALAAAPRLNSLLEHVRKQSPGNTNNVPVDTLRGYYRLTQDRVWRGAHADLVKLQLERQEIRGRSPVTLVQKEKMDSEPSAHVLFRGQYDQPREKVQPSAIASLHPMPDGAPKSRLGLAQWLVSPENPLTARVTVNRFWQEIFGDGLVRTVEDFGAMGERPVNPELLDWLAVEFRESGWNVKHIFRLMVMSSAYRQSAATSPRKLELDPGNRYLSRGPRFRMDAEMVRDYALAASGLLARQIGGPSVRPYQPPGVWEAVAMPESNTGNYVMDEGAALYRRSLYTFWKRAAPPAVMDLFNAPSRETCTVRRERTNTPLQALATLNDPEFVEAARHLAKIGLSRGSDSNALDEIALRLLSRTLTTEERGIVGETMKDMLTFYEKNPDAAKRLLTVGNSKGLDGVLLPRFAAMTMVVNQLMNLDEVLNK